MSTSLTYPTPARFRTGNRPYLWQLREEYRPAVEQALAQWYGAAEESDMGRMLMEQARRAVNEVYRDHLRDLSYDTKNSLLEELDDLNLEVHFRNLLTASVQYTVLTRCGLDLAGYLEDGDFSGIVEFSTPAVLHHLGGRLQRCLHGYSPGDRTGGQAYRAGKTRGG